MNVVLDNERLMHYEADIRDNDVISGLISEKLQTVANGTDYYLFAFSLNLSLRSGCDFVRLFCFVSRGGVVVFIMKYNKVRSIINFAG